MSRDNNVRSRPELRRDIDVVSDATLQPCNRQDHIVEISRIIDACNPRGIRWAGVGKRRKSKQSEEESGDVTTSPPYKRTTRSAGQNHSRAPEAESWSDASLPSLKFVGTCSRARSWRTSRWAMRIRGLFV